MIAWIVAAMTGLVGILLPAFGTSESARPRRFYRTNTFIIEDLSITWNGETWDVAGTVESHAMIGRPVSGRLQRSIRSFSPSNPPKERDLARAFGTYVAYDLTVTRTDPAAGREYFEQLRRQAPPDVLDEDAVEPPYDISDASMLEALKPAILERLREKKASPFTLSAWDHNTPFPILIDKRPLLFTMGGSLLCIAAISTITGIIYAVFSFRNQLVLRHAPD
ncbi:MAG TPA: hypothetical protein VK176_07320 [Phycisphaerales bacterium]|nr:hypothetical protein [Phycisphaerales bacterium]